MPGREAVERRQVSAVLGQAFRVADLRFTARSYFTPEASAKNPKAALAPALVPAIG